VNHSIKSRLSSLRDGVRRVSAYRDVLNAQIASLESAEKDARYKVDLSQKCSEVFKTWLEDSMKKNVDSMADLATTGLRHVIHDQVLTFKILQEPKYNRLAMRFLLEEDGVEGDPLASYGGGAAVLISLVLRIAVMSKMGMANLLLLDESMISVAAVYTPLAASFIRQLSEQTGVNILMVTHNPEYLSQAHVAYEGRKEGSLKLRRIASARSLNPPEAV
jgi:DNA repair exonuclease SbcCD ATPase subunit